MNATSKETHEELEKIVVDPEYRTGFLRLTRSLAPSGETFNRLEIRSATELEDHSTVLLPESRRDITKTLQKERKSKKEASEQKEIQITGVLRALHLDKDWLEVSPQDGDQLIRVIQTGDVIDDIVGPMVNQKVIVDVVVRQDTTYVYRDIQLEE